MEHRKISDFYATRSIARRQILAKLSTILRQTLDFTDSRIRTSFSQRMIKYDDGMQSRRLCSVHRYQDATGQWDGVQYMCWDWSVVAELDLDTVMVEQEMIEHLHQGGAERFSCLERRPFRSTGQSRSIPLSNFLGGAPLCRWYNPHAPWTSTIHSPPQGFPRPPTTQEIRSTRNAQLATDMNTLFVSETELPIWQRNWLMADARIVPHKGYIVMEQQLQHAWIWVLNAEGAMARRILVDPAQMAHFRIADSALPIALFFTITLVLTADNHNYQVKLAEASSPSAFPRTASP